MKMLSRYSSVLASALEVSELTLFYGSALVLDKVSMAIGPGELVGLAGRNGAGKTSLLRAISGLVHEKSGSISLYGKPLPRQPHLAARAGVTHLPEGRGLIPSMSVYDNIRVACVALGRAFDSSKTLSQFPMLRLLMTQHAGLLSGGQQQTVAIARAIATAPKVMLVDELSLGLAPKAAADALAILRRLSSEEGVPMIVVDQNVQALLDTCDRTYFLHRRQLVTSESQGADWRKLLF